MVGQLTLEGRGRRHYLSLFRSVSKALAFRPQRRSGGCRLQHLLAEVRVRDNFNRHEILIAAHVIGVVMRVDQVAKRFIGNFPDGRDKILRMHRPRRGIDHEHTAIADYDAGVGNALAWNARAAALDIGINIGCELPKLGFPARRLRESRVRRRWYYGRRGCRRRHALRPQARRNFFAC